MISLILTRSIATIVVSPRRAAVYKSPSREGDLAIQYGLCCRGNAGESANHQVHRKCELRKELWLLEFRFLSSNIVVSPCCSRTQIIEGSQLSTISRIKFLPTIRTTTSNDTVTSSSRSILNGRIKPRNI